MNEEDAPLMTAYLAATPAEREAIRREARMLHLLSEIARNVELLVFHATGRRE